MAKYPTPPKRQPSGKRRVGCEDYLMHELADAVAGQSFHYRDSNKAPECYKKYLNDPQKCIGAPGSNNWDRISAGARYAIQLSAWGIDYRQDVLNIEAVSWEKWGGKEIDSTTYEPFTGASDFAIQEIAKRRGDNEVYVKFLAHNRYRAARYVVMWDAQIQATAAVGQRSGGHAFHFAPPPVNGGQCHKDVTWIDAVVQIGSGLAVPRSAWRDGANPSYRLLWWTRQAMLDAFAGFNMDKEAALAYLREHKRKSITPMRLIEWPGGMAVQQPDCIHNATSPVLAYKRGGSAYLHCPLNRGDDGTRHYRHDSSTSCKLDVDVLRYRGSKYFPNQDIQLAPRSTWTRWVDIGGHTGYHDYLSSTQDPPPPPPTTETDNDDERSLWEKFVDWLEDTF